ncbi:hypothetical protein THICB1_20105 [Thiomonas arsenitoxydans]|uniref:Uncharacterized protein n=1 Tax=Thiomonas arsenitoxydans (strain DSM 22701 / CIP 110005 / 3As) TaxID=426114 RepID=A0ABP1Z297_THIA3|nr:hypothetical protein THICB1_20105 [Thiomonas arsenitoxydans]
MVCSKPKIIPSYRTKTYLLDKPLSGQK